MQKRIAYAKLDSSVRERGGRYVLQTKKDVLKLSDQQLPEQYAGEKVKVTGTLDTQTNTIQVDSIVPLTH